ncbi:hypothetical protein B0H14DRAFT_1089448 [Mycena olivaceomarginata]|nr:hypothetical protein B0H14DRAFT_1089448 [Mycena olivaceomarginata]
MDLTDRFPNELWLRVLSHLPPDALRSLSSTRRTLHALARPLGFTEFKLYPYPYEYRPPKAQIDDALARLDFWSSSRIASHVRTCTARFSPQMWQQGSELVEDSAGAPHVLMNAFFERLPTFKKLQRLYTDRIQFTQTGIANLCALPALTHAEFLACTVAAGERIDVEGLGLRVESFITRYDEQMNDLWVSLLSRDTLGKLDLSDLTAVAKPAAQPFPHVHTLTVTELPPRIGDTLAILTKFPGVRTFSSDYRAVLRNLTPPQASSIFPVLEEYTGPYENLHIFVQRSTLTHITLDTGYPFRNLLTELQNVNTLPNITSLTARFTSSAQAVFGGAELDTLFMMFPRLTALQLTIMPDAEEDGGFTPQATALLPTLAASPLLPYTLHSLSLAWDFPFTYGSTDSAQGNDPAPPDSSAIPGFHDMRGALVGRCPGLRYIFLDGYHFLFMWWTDEGWEASAQSFDEAEVLRAQHSERKYGPPVLIS